MDCLNISWCGGRRILTIFIYDILGSKLLTQKGIAIFQVNVSIKKLFEWWMPTMLSYQSIQCLFYLFRLFEAFKIFSMHPTNTLSRNALLKKFYAPRIFIYTNFIVAVKRLFLSFLRPVLGSICWNYLFQHQVVIHGLKWHIP